MTLQTELAAVFSESAAPSICRTADVQAQLSTVLDVAAKCQQQAAVHRQKLLAAETSATDPDATSATIERLYQTCGALETDAKELMTVGRRLVRSMAQYSRYADEIQAAIVAQDT